MAGTTVPEREKKAGGCLFEYEICRLASVAGLASVEEFGCSCNWDRSELPEVKFIYFLLVSAGTCSLFRGLSSWMGSLPFSFEEFHEARIQLM